MTEPITVAESTALSPGQRWSFKHPAWLPGVLAGGALVLSLYQIGKLLPVELWWQALFSPDLEDMRQIVVHESLLPRLVTCLLSGAQLSLSGAIFQQVLRNPLAEPTTLGVSAGASLALALTMLFAPQWLFFGREWFAFAGAGAAMLLVIALAWRRRLAPIALILAGLIVSLYFGSISAALPLFHREALQSLFIWGAGSLNQNNWDAVRTLAPHFIIGASLTVGLVRPLAVMSLSDGGARSLGVSLRFVRIAALTLAVFLGASVVAAVGVIGFLGMLAPIVVRLTGARHFSQRLIWAPLLGASLLWFTDELVQLLSNTQISVPTGAVMSLLGAPVLLWLLPRLPVLPQMPDASQHEAIVRPRRLGRWITLGAILLALAVVIGLALGRAPDGWWWAVGANFDAMLPWRAPRVAVALSAGAMLAMAGALMQRVTGNPMASPEVLGISAGASLGLILLIFIAPAAGHLLQIGMAGAGAFVTLLVMVTLGHRQGYAPERMLLMGVALGTAFSALVTVLLANNNPHMDSLLAWMAGSTYSVTESDAVATCASMVVLAVVAPLFARWLDILPLGETLAKSLGVSLAYSRIGLLLLAALMTGVATLVVGPLSFVGLMAPHLARMLGFRRANAQLLGAALLGAFIMVFADWLSRNLLFPFQIPVGLMATLIGGLYFMWLMLRGRTGL